MSQKLQSFLKFVLFLSIGIFLLWWVMKDYSIQDIWSKIKTANLNWIYFSAVFGLLSHWSRASRWKQLIISTGHKVDTKLTFYGVMIGYVANMAFPRMGEVVRGGVVSKYSKIPLTKLIGTVIAERAVDLFMLILILILTFFVQASLVADFIEEKIMSYKNVNLQLILIVLAICLIAVLVLLYTFNKFKESKFFIKLTDVLKGFWEGFKAIGKVENKLLFLFHTFFIWVMYFMMTYICFFSFEPTKTLGLDAGLTTLTFGSLGISAPVQGGIGTYHILVQNALMVYGVDAENALAFAWLVYMAQIFMVLGIGLFSFIMLSFYKPANSHVSSV